MRNRSIGLTLFGSLAIIVAVGYLADHRRTGCSDDRRPRPPHHRARVDSGDCGPDGRRRGNDHQGFQVPRHGFGSTRRDRHGHERRFSGSHGDGEGRKLR